MKMQIPVVDWKIEPFHFGNVDGVPYTDDITISDRNGFEVCTVEANPILCNWHEKLEIDHWADAPGIAHIERPISQVLSTATLIAAAPKLMVAAAAGLGALQRAKNLIGCDDKAVNVAISFLEEAIKECQNEGWAAMIIQSAMEVEDA